jgi:hypothetical protein
MTREPKAKAMMSDDDMIDWWARMQVQIEQLKAENERLQAQIEAWQDCAEYTLKRGKTVFWGWDWRALDRCRLQFTHGVANRANVAPDVAPARNPKSKI